LAEEAVPLGGEVVARDARKGLALRRADGPLRIAFRVRGLYPNDTWSGRQVTYTRLRCSGGQVTARVTSDAQLFSGTQTVRAEGRAVTFRPAQIVSLTVPLHPRAGGICRAAFTVTPTSVPALAQRGSADTRVLGAHFLGFRYSGP